MTNYNTTDIKQENIAVLLGGRSLEREISFLTGRAVVSALEHKGLNVDVIDWQGKNSIAQLTAKKYDSIFIALHGIDGEDGCIQSLLEILEIPYTGSGVLANALCIDKIRTKKILKAHNIPVLEDMPVTDSTDRKSLIDNIGFPMCIKPSKQGSSVGIQKVCNEKDLIYACEYSKNFGEELMAEPWLLGCDYTVAILNGQPLPSIRIKVTQDFYNYDAKYLTGDTVYDCPSGLSLEKENEIRALAKCAFDATDCSDWARVDFVADEQGNFYVLEINTVPGLTPTSLVPKAAKEAGIDFEELVSIILNNASLKQDIHLILKKDDKGNKALA